MIQTFTYVFIYNLVLQLSKSFIFLNVFQCECRFRHYGDREPINVLHKAEA